MKWLAIVPLLLVLVVPGVAAEVTGNCEVIILGQNIAQRNSSDPQDALDVRVGDNVTYSVTTTRAVRTFQLIAEAGPYEVILDDQNFTEVNQVTQIEGNTTFDGLPGGAAGVFRYRGEVTYWDGGECQGSVLIKIIPTSSLTPVLLAATVVAAGGLTGLILMIIRGYQDGKEVFDVVKDYVSEAREKVKK